MEIDLRYGGKKGKVIIHPGFIGSNMDDVSNFFAPHDIGIIVLPQEVLFPENADATRSNEQSGTFVRPICMPHPEKTKQFDVKPLYPFTKRHQLAINYNPSEFLYISGYSKKTLSKASFGALRNDDCQKRIQSVFSSVNISADQICAMSLPASDEIADTCQGDGGTPMVKFVQDAEKKIDDRGQLIGITSWGIGCGDGNPGVYTRVSQYMDWIQQYTSVMYTVDDQEIKSL